MAPTRLRKSAKSKLKPLQNKKEMTNRIDKMKENPYLRMFLLSLLPILFLIFGLVMFPPGGGVKKLDKAETLVESVGRANIETYGNGDDNVDEEKKVKQKRDLNDIEKDSDHRLEKVVKFEKLEKQMQKEMRKDDKKDDRKDKRRSVEKSKSTAKTKKGMPPPNIKSEIDDFKATIQTPLKIGPLELQGNIIKGIELKPSKSHNSSIRIYTFENFLTERECDGLIQAHKKHVQEYSAVDPIFCFDDILTLKKHLKDARKKSSYMSKKDFIPGTTCAKTNYSSELMSFLKWSYSTAFYPGESPFSKLFEDRVSEATGLLASNGGKFQITSYGEGIGYKTHTDCIVGGLDKRDRMATILVYLQDVTEGGETEFLELGIKVKPKKGMAIVWNNMDSGGHCEPLSLHTAAKVRAGHKYILQRWYYYKSFYSLGSRPQEPAVPERLLKTARVACDEYEHGSCRWYDEWNNDHLTEYLEQMRYLS